MTEVVEFAPAKINLALHVTGTREDGYHLLDSLVGFCNIGDTLTLRLLESDGPDELTYSGEYQNHLPAPQENIVLKAVNELRRAAKASVYACPPVSIHLSKTLPVAAGMGGGSANAAATLRGLKKLWQFPDSYSMDSIALSLGADVAMCLVSKPLRATGIGEIIQPIRSGPPINLLLVNPGIQVPTPQVFQNLKSKINKTMQGDLTAGLNNILPGLRNDLQIPAIDLYPVIGEVLKVLNKQQGCSLARMTGSGATCFGIFNTTQLAHEAASNIPSTHSDWWCKATKTLT